MVGASRSRTTIVLIDCCFSGAFLRGMRARSGGEANVQALVRDLPEGSGVAVLTASGEMEYSLEEADDRAAAATRPSYFTEAVVTGIGTGAADRDKDGRITIDELYDYVWDRIRAGPSPQRTVYGRLEHPDGEARNRAFNAAARAQQGPPQTRVNFPQSAASSLAAGSRTATSKSSA